MSQGAAQYGWLSQARGLVAEIRALSQHRLGRVVGVTVGAPRTVPHDDLASFLVDALPGCEVSVRERPGPLRLLSLEGQR